MSTRVFKSSLAQKGSILTFLVTESLTPDIEAFLNEADNLVVVTDITARFLCLFILKPGLWLAGKCHGIIRNHWVHNGVNYGLMLENFCALTSHLYISRPSRSCSITHFSVCVKLLRFDRTCCGGRKEMNTLAKCNTDLEEEESFL